MARHFPNAGAAISWSIDSLKTHGAKVDPGRWQGVPTEGKPDLVTQELLDLDLSFPIADTMPELVEQIQPNVPWAENHFQERVSRNPSNPGVEFKSWPWWRGQDALAMAFDPEQGLNPKFSHTYQERFWPAVYKADEGTSSYRMGIRYRYGDLDDVVKMMYRDPQTRQAYFPIFFPEDTGAVHGGRIPCTLGYHFLLRSNLLHCWYDIRSCDAVRHFRDDLYLAARLVQWVIAELVEMEMRSDSPQVWVDVNPGTLFFKAHSFHVHMGDYHLLP